MKKIFSIFLFVISLVFLSCSSAFDDNTGKIEFSLPYGSVGNARAAGLNASETDVIKKSYAFYLRFTSSSVLENKIESGQSGDRVIVEDMEPGLWTITALACEVENKKDFEEYILERGEEAFEEPNETMGYDYFMGKAKAQVNAGQTSNVLLSLSKVLQENEVFTGITVRLSTSEEKITSKNYDTFMQNACLYGKYERRLGDEVIDTPEYEIYSDFTYTKLEPGEIGNKPVVFTYTDENGEVYNSAPVIVPVYYDFADSVDDIKLSFEPEYSVSKGDELILSVSASSEDFTLKYYPENSDSPEDAVSYAFELVPLSAVWTKAGAADPSPLSDKEIEYSVDTSSVGTFVYYNTTIFTLASINPKVSLEINKYILPAIHSPVEIKVNVLALPEYTVTFVKAGSEPETYITIETKSVTKGEKVEQPVVSVEEGYTFHGWYEDDGYYNPFNFENPIKKDITLYGLWTKNETPKYTITFVSAFTDKKEVTVEEGTILKSPEALTSEPIEGYVFDGWYTDKDFTTLYTFSAPIISSFILYGKWIELPKYTVTFVFNGKADEVTVIEGKTVSPTGTTATEGYRFDGWYTDESFSGDKYDFDTPVKTNLMLYARNIPIEYTITYILNDGTNAEANPTVYTIESGKITLIDPSKEGYDFEGWLIIDEATGQNSVIKEIEPTTLQNITLTASWKLKSFKITFVNPETDKAFAEQFVDYLGKVSAPEFTEIMGYTFKGWYADKELTKEFDFDTPVVSELTIYGKWLANSNSGVHVDFPEEPVTGQITFTLTSDDKVIQPGSDDYYTVKQGEIVTIKADFDVENSEEYIINWDIDGENSEIRSNLLELDTSKYLGYTHIICSIFDTETQKIIFTGNLNVAVIQ